MIPNSIIQRLNIWLRKIDQDGNFIADGSENLIYTLETDESINKGDALILKSNGYVGKAIATINNKVDFISLETVDGSSNITKIKVCNIGAGISSNTTFDSSDIGKDLYLSETEYGKYSTSIPTTDNSFIVKIGSVLDTNKIIFIGSSNNKFVQFLNQDIKTDWNGSDKTWNISFDLDVSKPYLVIRDHIILEKSSDFTISGRSITFSTAPQSFTQVIGFDLINESGNIMIPPVMETKSDWDGNNNIWDLSFTPTLTYPIAVFADSRFLELNIDYTINENKIIFNFNPSSFTTIISYPNITQRLLTPKEETIIASNDGQTHFTLSKFTYTPNTNDITVYRNGILLENNNINEINDHEFQIKNISILKNDRITVKKIGVINSELYNKDLTKVLSPIEEKIIISENQQTNIILSNISYEVGKQQLEVFHNGQKLTPDDYTEINSNQIKLNYNNTLSGDEILIRRLGISPTTSYSKIGQIIYKTTGLDVKNNNGIINLNFTYNIGYNQLIVVINGIEIFEPEDYTETNNSSITINNNIVSQLSDTDKIVVKKLYCFS